MSMVHEWCIDLDYNLEEHNAYGTPAKSIKLYTEFVNFYINFIKSSEYFRYFCRFYKTTFMEYTQHLPISAIKMTNGLY